jgi:type I restriction enzyme, S subunit
VSRIDELIAAHCPDGVEFRELQDLFTTKNGYTPSKSDQSAWTNGTVPWFRMEDIRLNGHILDSSLQLISGSAVKGGRLFPANSILIATSATIGEHALITVPHLSNQRFTSLTLKPEFVDRLDMNFVFYYCFVLDEWCRDNTTISSFASVDMAGFKRFAFPIPPLEVQREVVEMLDKLAGLETDLEAELEAELKARQTQYAYYRDFLFPTPDSDQATWVAVNDVAAVFDGTHQTPHYTETGIKFVSVENIRALYDSRKFISEEDFHRLYKTKPRRDDVLMTRIGSVGACAVVDSDEPLAYYVSLALIRPNQELVNSRYLKHLIESGVGAKELRKRTLVNAVPIKINLGDVGKLRLPFPSLEEQERIASTLDELDAIFNDLSSALPSELDARRQQFEHYRGKLLAFEELPA